MSFWNYWCSKTFKLAEIPNQTGKIKKSSERESKLNPPISGIKTLSRAEILEKFLLVFRKIWRHQKDILKPTDL